MVLNDGFSLFGKRRVSLLATRELNKLKAVAQKLSIISDLITGGATQYCSKLIVRTIKAWIAVT